MLDGAFRRAVGPASIGTVRRHRTLALLGAILALVVAGALRPMRRTILLRAARGGSPVIVPRLHLRRTLPLLVVARPGASLRWLLGR
jgi:hypothetical protein